MRHLNAAILGVWILLNSSAYSYGDITSTGEKPIANHTAAISRDLYPALKGRSIYTPSRGWVRINDKMGANMPNGRPIVRAVDFRLENANECRRYGRRPVWVWVGEPGRVEGRNPH